MCVCVCEADIGSLAVTPLSVVCSQSYSLCQQHHHHPPPCHHRTPHTHTHTLTSGRSSSRSDCHRQASPCCSPLLNKTPGDLITCSTLQVCSPAAYQPVLSTAGHSVNNLQAINYLTSHLISCILKSSKHNCKNSVIFQKNKCCTSQPFKVLHQDTIARSPFDSPEKLPKVTR